MTAVQSPTDFFEALKRHQYPCETFTGSTVQDALKLFFAWYLAKDNKNVQVITHPILSMGFEGCSFRVVYIRTENLKRITFRARTEKAAYKKRDDGLAKRKRDLREAVIESVVYRPLKSECDFIVSYFFPKTSKKKK